MHRSTCPHTPQQNGITERKNRHLVETVRTLLLGANMPVHYWGDAILTACYLINEMLSSLKNKVPYSILFPKEPLFHITSRVFGCVCFVHDMSPSLHKLSARSIKCVFLGYSRLQKGYQCYSPETKKYYMTAHVTFFEQSPFFPTTTCDSNFVQHVLPIPFIESPAPIVQNIVSNPTEPLAPPIFTYQRRNQMASPILQGESSFEGDSPSSLGTTTPDHDDLNWPIAIRRGTRSTRKPHPIYNFLSYHRVSPSYFSFISFVSSITIPKTVKEALDHSGWRQAMISKM